MLRLNKSSFDNDEAALHYVLRVEYMYALCRVRWPRTERSYRKKTKGDASY